MTDGSLAKKLQMKPGQKALILNAPSGYLEDSGELPHVVFLADKPEGTFDFVQLFVTNIGELERLASAAIQAIKRDGVLWISYPKQSSKVETNLTRDVGWEPLLKAGLRPVSQVSINEVWSALRFRPSELVRGKERSTEA